MTEVSIESSGQAAPKEGWLSRRIANVFLSRIAEGRLTIVAPSGRRFVSPAGRPGPDAVLMLRSWRALWRTALHGDVAFGTAYIDGDWDSPDLSAIIELAARNAKTFDAAIAGNALSRFGRRLAHRLNANSRRRSRRNIAFHYDLGNKFYAAWLDPGMTYSSALYTDADQGLDAAQTAKQDRALTLLEPRDGDRVLEIGCGWGGQAERLLSGHNCNVVGLTLSPAQHAYATPRLAPFGPRADVRLQDYRDIDGTFDRIVSIEMLEAVGEAWWPKYFATLHERLAAGGIAVLQAITIAADRYESYRRAPDFVQRYIFPGGMLATREEIERQAARAGLIVRRVEQFGASYARTLTVWRERFLAAWPEVERMGFDTRFRRMWTYYLDYCAGGFRAGAIDVGFYVLAKPEVPCQPGEAC